VLQTVGKPSIRGDKTRMLKTMCPVIVVVANLSLAISMNNAKLITAVDAETSGEQNCV
jgi:hypothetical protein